MDIMWKPDSVKVLRMVHHLVHPISLNLTSVRSESRLLLSLELLQHGKSTPHLPLCVGGWYHTTDSRADQCAQPAEPQNPCNAVLTQVRIVLEIGTRRRYNIGARFIHNTEYHRCDNSHLNGVRKGTVGSKLKPTMN